MLPDCPDEIPNWAQGIPEEICEEPDWPKDYYGTGGPHPCPWGAEDEVCIPLNKFDRLIILIYL